MTECTNGLSVATVHGVSVFACALQMPSAWPPPLAALASCAPSSDASHTARSGSEPGGQGRGQQQWRWR
jgi:hypothetical protein